jgi:hyperosmotically inducible periplasmic protein
MSHKHIQLRSIILASTMTLALAGIGATANAATSAQEVTDAGQQARIETTYALNPYLRANEISVSVKNTKATLTGTVEEGVNKELAEQIALQVAGIESVDNQIKIEPGYTPPRRSEDRSYGELIDDASITAAVKSKLLWSRHASAMTTNVETNRGRVTLKGTAETAAAKELASLLANNTHGVVSVDNQIRVEAPKPGVAETAKETTDAAGSAISDTWITTKVRSTLMYSSNVHSSAIDVSTKDGVVTLKGKAATGAERELAVELAKNVQGVVSVDAQGLKI